MTIQTNLPEAAQAAASALEQARAVRDGMPHGPERRALNVALDRVDVAISAAIAQPAELTNARLLEMAAEAETPAWGEWFSDEDALLRFARAVRAA